MQLPEDMINLLGPLWILELRSYRSKLNLKTILRKEIVQLVEMKLMAHSISCQTQAPFSENIVVVIMMKVLMSIMMTSAVSIALLWILLSKMIRWILLSFLCENYRFSRQWEIVEKIKRYEIASIPKALKDCNKISIRSWWTSKIRVVTTKLISAVQKSIPWLMVCI